MNATRAAPQSLPKRRNYAASLACLKAQGVGIARNCASTVGHGAHRGEQGSQKDRSPASIARPIRQRSQFPCLAFVAAAQHSAIGAILAPAAGRLFEEPVEF